jgi:hypothetical protein
MNGQANIGMGIGGDSDQEDFVWEDMTNYAFYVFMVVFDENVVFWVVAVWCPYQ